MPIGKKTFLLYSHFIPCNKVDTTNKNYSYNKKSLISFLHFNFPHSFLKGVSQTLKRRHLMEIIISFYPNNTGGLLTLRRLMSYTYGAPILDVSRSHTTTQHSR